MNSNNAMSFSTFKNVFLHHSLRAPYKIKLCSNTLPKFYKIKQAVTLIIIAVCHYR